MTIAAGFKIDDGGVLLCADELHASPSTGAFHFASKIRAGTTRKHPRVHCGFVYAGNENNAKLAIDKLSKVIGDFKESDFDELLERGNRVVYSVEKRYVNHGPEGEIDNRRFELLMALSRADWDCTQLLKVQSGAIRIVDQPSAFIGVGEAYAECVGRVTTTSSSSLEVALLLANRTLSTAKRYCINCGGPSDFTLIHSAFAPTVSSFPEPFIEDWIAEYENAMDRILLMSVQGSVTADQIAGEFYKLAASAYQVSFKWRATTRTIIDLLKGIQP